MSALAYRNSEQRNKQNQHVVSNLHNAHAAVNRLIDCGLTITDVTVSGSKPVIEIQYQDKGLESLCGVNLGRSGNNEGFDNLYQAVVLKCLVKWKEPAYVEDLRRIKQQSEKSGEIHHGKF